MNDRILDTPFENEFHLKLQDGEEILWENEVYSNWNFSHIPNIKITKVFIVLLFYFIIPIMVHFITRITINKMIMLISFLLGIFFLLLFLRKKIHKKYILTNLRLVFHFGRKEQSYVLDIDIAEIKTIDVAMKNLSNYNGDILLEVNDLETKKNVVYFSNYNPNEEIENIPKQLVILNVKNTPKVLKLIRQARLKAKGI